MKRYPPRWTQRPYRSGMRGAPITLELLLVWAIMRQMRLQLELYYPREKTRWN